MSTKKETNKPICKTFWITEELERLIRKLKINVSDTCRKALIEETKRLSRPR